MRARLLVGLGFVLAIAAALAPSASAGKTPLDVRQTWASGSSVGIAIMDVASGGDLPTTFVWDVSDGERAFSGWFTRGLEEIDGGYNGWDYGWGPTPDGAGYYYEVRSDVIGSSIFVTIPVPGTANVLTWNACCREGLLGAPDLGVDVGATFVQTEVSLEPDIHVETVQQVDIREGGATLRYERDGRTPWAFRWEIFESVDATTLRAVGTWELSWCDDFMRVCESGVGELSDGTRYEWRLEPGGLGPHALEVSYPAEGIAHRVRADGCWCEERRHEILVLTPPAFDPAVTREDDGTLTIADDAHGTTLAAARADAPRGDVEPACDARPDVVCYQIQLDGHAEAGGASLFDGAGAGDKRDAGLFPRAAQVPAFPTAGADDDRDGLPSEAGADLLVVAFDDEGHAGAGTAPGPALGIDPDDRDPTLARSEPIEVSRPVETVSVGSAAVTLDCAGGASVQAPRVEARGQAGASLAPDPLPEPRALTGVRCGPRPV